MRTVLAACAIFRKIGIIRLIRREWQCQEKGVTERRASDRSAICWGKASAAVSCRCPLQEITSHSSINSPRQKIEKLKVRWSKRERERYRCQICVDLWVAVEVMKFNCVMLYLMFTKYKPRIQNRTNRSSCYGYSIVPNASTLSKAYPIINMDGALFSVY